MLEKENNLDRRKRRTRQCLKDALISLLGEKDFQSITVQDITNIADVNRATFYAHYHDKYDLLQKLVDEILHEFEEIFISSSTIKNDQRHPYDLYVSIFKHFQQWGDFYKVSRKGVPGLWRRLSDIICDATNRRRAQLYLDEQQLAVPHDIMNSFISSAYLGVTIDWIEKGMPYTPEYMAEKLTFIIDRYRNGSRLD